MSEGTGRIGPRQKRELATELETALRRETRDRRMAERVARRQWEAQEKTLALLGEELDLSAFIRAMMRSIIRECGGVWARLWSVEESLGEQCDSWVQASEPGVAQAVAASWREHPAALARLGDFYRGLIQEDRDAVQVRADDLRIPEVFRRRYRRFGVKMTLLVPLVLGRRTIGWISHHRKEADLSADCVAFIRVVARQAALAVRLTRLNNARRDLETAQAGERAARERERDMEAINQLLRVDLQAAGGGVDALLAGALRNTTKLLGGTWGILWRTDEDLDHARPVWVECEGEGRPVSADAGAAMAGRCRLTYRARVLGWHASDDARLEEVSTRRARLLLAALEAPVPAGAVARLACIPLHLGGESRGFMLVLMRQPPPPGSDRWVAVRALAMQAALALSLEQMSTVQRSAALAQERNRIARDLHDLLAQSFTGIAMQIEAARAEFPGLPESVEVRLEKIREQATRSSEELRRTLMMLQPTALDRRTLPAALRVLATEAEAHSPVRVNVHDLTAATPLPPRVEQHLYAVASEALQNALRHASPSDVSIELLVSGGEVSLRVEDNGRPRETPKARGEGRGLRNIRARAEEMQARVSLRQLSGRTRLEVVAPLDPA